MNIAPEILVLIGTLTGAIIGSSVSIIINYQNKKYDEKKHRREIILNVAIDSWKRSVETVVSAGSGIIYGYDVYIIHMLKLSELLDGDKLTTDNVVRVMKEVDDVTKKVIEYKNSLTKKDSTNNSDSPVVA